MSNRLKLLNKIRIVNADSRRVGRRVHAEKRLRERFGVDYIKVKHVVENGGAKVVLDCETKNKVICLVNYMGHEIYFVLFHNQITTFLTKEMVKRSYPEIFEPEKTIKKQKKTKKRKKKQPVFIPASELFKE